MSALIGNAFQTLKVDLIESVILQVRLNRPQVANAINTEMMHELSDLWSLLYRDPTPYRCVVLTGQGHHFCAGADLKERQSFSDEQWLAQHALIEQLFRHLMVCPIPIIAAVNGTALGGGLELVLASDFAYAVAEAQFALPEVKRGIMPGACGTQWLPRLCGAARAREILYTGQSFSASEALAWGLVNQVVDGPELMGAVMKTARSIAANAPLSIRQVKKSVQMALQTDLQTGYQFEIEAYNRLVPTSDRREGVAAFNEKRAPVFQGQ